MACYCRSINNSEQQNDHIQEKTKRIFQFEGKNILNTHLKYLRISKRK